MKCLNLSMKGETILQTRSLVEKIIKHVLRTTSMRVSLSFWFLSLNYSINLNLLEPVNDISVNYRKLNCFNI